MPESMTGSGMTRYPWADMEIGDSFKVVCAKGARVMRRSAVMAAARSWKRSKKAQGKMFVSRVEEGGFRVWRLT